MRYDFDEIIDRKGTGSVRWDSVAEKYGNPNVIPLTTADMGFRIAAPIRDAIIDSANHGIYGYTRPRDSYYDAVIDRLASKSNWNVPREWITYSPGIVGGIAFCIQGMTDPGDRILLLTPMYHPFSHIIENNGRVCVNVKLDQSTTPTTIDYDLLQDTIKSEQVKAMIFCNPHNPIGRAWTAEEITKVCGICIENDVLLFSDEIHSDFIYTGHTFNSAGPIMSMLGGDDKIVVCSSGSKTFNIAGLQCSNIIIPDSGLRARYRDILMRQHYMELNAIGPVATEAAYRYGDEWLEQLMVYLEGNRDFIVDFIQTEIPGITPIMPEATYMMWLDCRELRLQEGDLDHLITRKAGLGLNMGSTFGPGGEGYVRINFAEPRSLMEEAMQRLKNVVVTL